MDSAAGPWRSGDRFPLTHRSIVAAAGEDAEDATQEFFASALVKGTFERYDSSKARFRTYLHTCLDGFAANERKAAGRLKRGGGQIALSLDFEGAEEELGRYGAGEELDVEEYFHREWVRSLFGLAVEDLRRWSEATGKTVHFLLFERYDLEGSDAPERPTYAELAAETRLPVTQVTNFLVAARREFRRLVLELVSHTHPPDPGLPPHAGAADFLPGPLKELPGTLNRAFRRNKRMNKPLFGQEQPLEIHDPRKGERT